VLPRTVSSGNFRTARSNLSNSSAVRTACRNDSSSAGVNTNSPTTDSHKALPAARSPVGGFGSDMS
jgi:hypothetical protein